MVLGRCQDYLHQCLQLILILGFAWEVVRVGGCAPSGWSRETVHTIVRAVFICLPMFILGSHAQVKNIERIELGRHQMDTWYFSPFPPEYKDCKVGFGAMLEAVHVVREAVRIASVTGLGRQQMDTVYFSRLLGLLSLLVGWLQAIHIAVRFWLREAQADAAAPEP